MLYAHLCLQVYRQKSDVQITGIDVRCEALHLCHRWFKVEFSFLNENIPTHSRNHRM